MSQVYYIYIYYIINNFEQQLLLLQLIKKCLQLLVVLI